MENEFIPYEESLVLKELGFDGECFAFYNGKFLDFKIQGGDVCAPYLSTENKGECLNVPLYQQAFRWFREKYNLDSFVKHLYEQNIKIGYYFGINKYESLELNSETFTKYEEAELECLRTLIEIVKNKL